ncbi:golgin subfamily A member 4-like isoform X3 [Branchiostoma floridae]|uniref:Golgin subfamily A member 4-like isoform X3 n=1 Tax=Branchiostoma floridae TaxID=7739 RepID=A0A9J7KK22_BRAFL|nr:golgin subfamily A member 4-like isoform X3 [Branchiostoma floridae]
MKTMGTSEIYVITCMVMTLLLHEAHAQQENLSSAVTRLDAQFRSMERRLRTQNVVRDNQNKKLLEQNRRQTEKLRLLTGQLDKVQAKVVDVTSALETSKLDASDARQKAVEMQTIVGRQEATIMDLNMRVQALEGAKIAYESTLSSLQRKLDSVEAVAVNRPTSGIDLGSDSDEDSLFDYDSIFVAQEPDSKKKKLGNKAIQKLLRNHTIEISRLMRRQSSASKSLGGLENDVKKNVLAISDLKLKDKALEGTLSRTTSQILEFSSQRTVFGATVSSIRSEVSSVRRRMDETANKVSNATAWIATMDTKTKRLGNSLSNLMSDYRRYFGSQSSGEKTIGEIVKDLKEEDGKLMEGIKANDVGLLDLENRMENMESRVGRNPWPIDTPNQNAASSEKITEMRRDLTRLEADLQRAQGEVRGAMTMLTAHVQETSYLPRKISNLDRLLQGYGIFINSFQDQTDEIKYTIKEQNQTIFEMQLAVNGLQDTFVSLFPESSGKSSRQQKQMDRMGDKLKEMGVNIERLTGRVSAVQQIAASVEPMKNQIQNISTFMTNLNGTAQKLELVTGRVTTLEDQGPEFQALKDKVFVIDKIAGSIPLVQRNVTTLQEEVAQVDTFAQKMRNLERSMAVVGGKVAELNNVKKATNMLEERADNFDLGLQEISKVTKDMEALQERMFRVKSKVSEIDSLMTMVLIGANTTSNTIPGPDESTDEKDAAILELEGQIDVLRSALQKLTSQLENYTTESNQKMSEIERSIIFGVGGSSPINVGEGESTASPGAIMAFSGQLREAMEKVEMMVNAMQNQATSISDNTLKIRELGDLVQQFGTVSPGGNVIAELQTKLSILEQMLQPGNIPTLDSAGRSFDFAELEGMRQQLTGALATSSELTNRIQQLESLYQTSIASKPTESGGLSVDVEERFAKVENDSIAARKLIQTIRDSVEASVLEMQGQVAKLEAFSDTYSSLANSLQTVNEGETQADSQTFKVIATDLAGLKSNVAILQNTIRAYDPRILVVGQLEMAVAEIDDRLKQYISRQQSTSSTNLQELAQVQVRSEELQKTVDGLRAAVASFESRLQDVSSRPAAGVSQPVDAFVEYHNEISELINNANQVNLTLSRHQAILKTLQTQYAANKVMINNVMGSIQQQPSQPIQPPQPAVELESIARLETALTNHDAALSDVRAEIANHDSQMIQLKSMFAQSHASVAQFESKTTELGNMISVNRHVQSGAIQRLERRTGRLEGRVNSFSVDVAKVRNTIELVNLTVSKMENQVRVFSLMNQSRDYDTTELMNITLDSVDENNGTILPTIQKINKIGDQTRQLAQLRSDVTVLNNGLVRLNRDLVMMRSDMANKSGVVDQLTRLNITGAMQQIGTKILSLEATVNGHSAQRQRPKGQASGWRAQALAFNGPGSYIDHVQLNRRIRVLEALIDEAKSKFEEQGGDIDKLKTMDTNFDYRLNIQVQKIMSLENDRGAIENALKKHQEIIQRLDAASTNQNTVLSSLEEKMSSSGETGKLTENSIENELGGISSTLIGRLEKVVTNNSLVIVDIQKSLSLHDQSMVRLDTMVSVHHDILSRMSTTTSEFRTEIDALQTAVKDLEWLVEEGGATILPTGDLEVDAVTESVNNNTRSLVQVRQSISGIIENLGKMEAVVEDLRQTTSSVDPSGSASPNQGDAEDTLTPERANELIANNPFVTQLANRLANQSLVIDDLQDITQAQYKQIGELESEVGDRFAEMSSRVDAVSTDMDARIAAVATNLGGESENGGSFLQKPDEELADVKDAIDKLDGRTFALELTMRNHSGAISFLREDVDLLAYGSSGDGASPVTGVDAQLVQRLQETTRRQSAMLEGHSAAISEISVKMDDIARLQQHALHPDTATSSQGSGSPDTANLLAVLLKHNNTLARMEVEMKVLADYLEGQSRESRPSVSGSSDPSGFTMLSRSVAQVELDLRSQEETLQYLGADITRLRLDLEKVNTTARSRKMPTGSNQGVTDSEDIWEALAAIEDKNEQQEDIIQSHTSDISSLLATSRDLNSRLSGLSSTGGPESVPAGDLAEIVADLDDLKSKYSNMTATVRFVQQLSNKAGIAATEWNKKRQFFERLLDSHTSAILQLMDKTNAIDAQMSLHLSETKMQSSAGGRSSGGRSGERPGGRSGGRRRNQKKDQDGG